jgi:diacylglycerol kinase (ATP)
VPDVPDLWWLVVLGVVAVLLVGGLVGTARSLRRRDRASEHVITAEPEDRPLAAVVVNPVKIDELSRDEIAAVCAGLGWAPPLWLPTTPEDPGTGQAREAISRGADVVIACGGDGTVRAVAQSLAGTRVAMGLVPTGTGNLLARTLRIPLDVASATRVALTGDDRAIDVGRLCSDPDDPADDLSDDPADPGDRADERVFLVMAGTGLDATIMQSTPEDLKGRVGPLAYIISGLRAIDRERRRAAVAAQHAHGRRRQHRQPRRRTGADARRHGRRRAPRRGEPRPEGAARLGGRTGPRGEPQPAGQQARRALAGARGRHHIRRRPARPGRRRPHRGGP